MTEPGRPNWFDRQNVDGFSWAQWYGLVEIRARAALAAAFAERSTKEHPWDATDWHRIAVAINRLMVLFYETVRHGNLRDPLEIPGELPSLILTVTYDGGAQFEFPFNLRLQAAPKAPRLEFSVPLTCLSGSQPASVTFQLSWKADLDPFLVQPEGVTRPYFADWLRRELGRQLGIPLDLGPFCPRGSGSLVSAVTELDELWDLRVRLSDFLRRFLTCLETAGNVRLSPFLVFLLTPNAPPFAELDRGQQVQSGLFGYRYVIDPGQDAYLQTLTLASGKRPAEVIRTSYVPFPAGQCSQVYLAGRAADPFAANVHIEASPSDLMEVERLILNDSTLMELPVYGTHRMYRQNAPDGPELLLCIALPNPCAEPAVPVSIPARRVDAVELAPPPESNFVAAESQLVREIGQKMVIRHATPSTPVISAGPIMIGTSEVMRELATDVAQIADSDEVVLIFGESGTGKEIIAELLHARSARRRKPYVKVNCAAIPQELIESELFGHEKGSFTGASAQYIGRFEAAKDGTIFLDEIGDLRMDAQAKVLRVLESGELQRIGSARTINVDVRIVAATNKRLSDEIKAGQFRDDLYYRLNVVPIKVPPLRDRVDDIPLLLGHFLAQHPKGGNKRFDLSAIAWMQANYQWPGNVRQLRNLVRRACTKFKGNEISLEWVMKNADDASADN